jgi:hypothetical protein
MIHTALAAGIVQELRLATGIEMTEKHFEKSLQQYQKRSPFRSYRVRFISGEHVDVDHPEALVTRGGVAVYLAADGTPTLFDHESVSEVVGKTDRKRSA